MLRFDPVLDLNIDFDLPSFGRGETIARQWWVSKNRAIVPRPIISQIPPQVLWRKI